MCARPHLLLSIVLFADDMAWVHCSFSRISSSASSPRALRRMGDGELGYFLAPVVLPAPPLALATGLKLPTASFVDLPESPFSLPVDLFRNVDAVKSSSPTSATPRSPDGMAIAPIPTSDVSGAPGEAPPLSPDGPDSFARARLPLLILLLLLPVPKLLPTAAARASASSASSITLGPHAAAMARSCRTAVSSAKSSSCRAVVGGHIDTFAVSGGGADASP